MDRRAGSKEGKRGGKKIKGGNKNGGEKRRRIKKEWRSINETKMGTRERKVRVNEKR